MSESGRWVALEGARNFRDLGGYEGAGGRSVRRGLVFRSDSLADLTEADLVTVGGIGLRAVCDLREDHERSDSPNRFLGASVRAHALRVFPLQAQEMFDALDSMSVRDIEEWLCGFYRSLVVDHCVAYGRFLRVLVEPGGLPAVVHCTGGRDRTGMAAAGLLLALGVSEETIVEDYLLSDIAHRDVAAVIGGGVDPEKVTALTKPRAEYLQTAFASMTEAFGSPDGYLSDGLALDDERRARLRDLLLEP